MATRSYTSRRELEQHSFHPAITLLVPFAAVLLQSLLPKPLRYFGLFDLPLIVTIFFAVSRRSPVAGTLTGAAIGLLQDALTSQPIGVNGMAKALIGYAAASIGVQVDVENFTTRILMNFCFSLVNSLLLFLIHRRLLGMPSFHLNWWHELICAVANALIALPIFFLLDRARSTD
jgi:rod shape-determining protein MreD